MPEPIQIDNFRTMRRPQPLHSFGGGGTSGGMDVVDAKIAVSEAKTDTKFAELRGDLAKFGGEMGVLSAEMRNIKDSTSGVKMTVITTGIATAIAIIGLVIGVFAYGSQMFGTGLDVQIAADRAAAAVEARYSAQNATTAQEMSEATIALTNALAQIKAQSTEPAAPGP